jgi:hypothetical protein
VTKEEEEEEEEVVSFCLQVLQTCGGGFIDDVWTAKIHHLHE